ncbi:DUF2914 domain-containing protein [Gallaecimonas kandeliae]|uniref:DUF2914 domain-containing protein n=1 Tax=Gallaecimonas kandeliae TaxID=3029055 RepID=UPI00264A269B|nr:DUF2914 domain-containing protein [Gallaecimonas kandeliae]WKE65567.1 DUF2914 domain-containing protein [Gallaecimonas kandeliae]
MSRRFLWLLLSLLSPLVLATPDLSRVVLCRDVVQREPVGVLQGDQLPKGLDKLVLFTEVHGGAGQKLHHRWYFNGALQADIALPLGADRWRTWSQKHIRPGTWRLEVLSDDGTLLYQHTLVESTAP